MGQPYSILGIDDFPYPGGAQLVFLEQLSQLDRSLFTPHVILPRPGTLSELYSKRGIQPHFVDLAAMKKYYYQPHKLVQTILSIRNIIRLTNADLIHVNSLWCLQFAAPAVSASSRSLVVSVHAFPIIHNPIKRLLFRVIRSVTSNHIARCIAVSEALAASLVNSRIFQQDKIEVITNGINLTDYDIKKSGKSWRKQHKAPDDAILVGVIGRIHPGKGQGVFLEAALKVLKLFPDNVYFLVIGEEYETELESRYFVDELTSRIYQEGIQERFQIVGFQPDISSVYAALDIVTLPSFEETFGMTLLEGMAMGKPVIASRTGGIPELVTDGACGILVPVGNAKALAESIITLIENPELRLQMGKEARQRAVTHFDMKERMQRLERLYQTILGTP